MISMKLMLPIRMELGISGTSRGDCGSPQDQRVKCKIYLLDEAQRLTGDAQGALLKMLEDPPYFVYFILCTTDPQKLRKEIHTRSTHIKFREVRPKDMHSLLLVTMQKIHNSKEGDRYLSDVVYDKIVDAAEGSPRKALVLLGQIIDIKDEEDQLEAIEKSSLKAQGFQIAQSLIYGKPWKEIAKMINDVDEEPETIRRIILGYAVKVLTGGGKFASRAYVVIEACRDTWYDCGKAGLAASCFDVCHAGKR
jgi:DNA polymerase III delta prime subunit